MPGVRLRIAREALGLNLADIAIHLKLDVEKVNDLENDQVDTIAAPVFLLGYLRAYARLVNLPAEELIDDFERLVEMTPPSLKPAARSSAPSHLEKVSDKLPAHMTLANKGWSGIVIGALLILAVLVAGLLWWNSQKNTQSGNTQSRNTDVQQPAFAISQEPLPDDNTPVLLAPEMLASEMPKAEMEKQEPFLFAQDNLAQPDGSAEIISVESVNENMIESNDLDFNAGQAALPIEDSTTDANLPDSFLSADEPVLETGDELALLSGKQEKLTFFFSEDSWIEVTDAINQRLLYRLGRVGDTVTVSGVAPFNVHLGYQPGVRILLNDDPYSLSRFGNRRIIRFQLDVDKNQQDNA